MWRGLADLNLTAGETLVVTGAGDVVARRSLEFYDALGRVMAVKGNA